MYYDDGYPLVIGLIIYIFVSVMLYRYFVKPWCEQQERSGSEVSFPPLLIVLLYWVAAMIAAIVILSILLI